MLAPGAALAQDSAPMQLLTRFTGGARCLDIADEPGRNRLVMADCADVRGQAWRLVHVNGTPWKRLQNALSGPDLCLDVINDGRNNRVHMAPCANYSGQMWSMRAPLADPGALWLTNAFTEDDRCLDIINDGANDKLTITPCDTYSGQKWLMRPIP